MAQWVKNLPTMQKTPEAQIQSLVWEDPLEEGVATDQYFCLDNSMDREVWWPTVHRVAKSWT